MKTWKSVKTNMLADQKVLAEYQKLEPEFELADQLIRLRLGQNLTQQQLAQKAGMKQAAIARLEQGENVPNYRTLHRVAQALGKKVELV